MAWKSIQSLAEAIPEGKPDTSRNLDGLLTAFAEDMVEAVNGARPDEVTDGVENLRGVLKAMMRKLPADVRRSPEFRAGQVAMAVNMLGTLANRMPSEAFHTQIKAEGNQPFLAALWNKELRNVDLAKQLGDMDEGQVSRTLKTLQEAGVVVRQRVGREVYSRLSLAAQAELESRFGSGEALTRSKSETMHRRMWSAPLSVPIGHDAPPPRLSSAREDEASRTGTMG